MPADSQYDVEDGTLISEAGSTGGLIALVVKKLPAKTGAKLGKE
jgi:hypothetical protein